MFMATRSILLFSFVLVVLLSGCKKDKDNQVPLTTVDINVNVNLPEYNALAVTGGWVYLTGGVEGLIVYRNSPDEFTAMDRLCTYHTEDLCRVYVDDSQVIARDTLSSGFCGSAFLILDGSVTQGPASLGLKVYHTTFNGTTLHIFN